MKYIEKRQNNEQNIHIISTTEKEIEELEQEEQHDYGNRLKTEQRYDFYQKETYFFRKLSGYLTDKKQELEIVQIINNKSYSIGLC